MNQKRKILIIAVAIIAVILIIYFCALRTDPAANPPIGDNTEQNNINNTSDNTIETDEYVSPQMPDAVKLDITKKINGLEISNIELQMLTERDCELRATAYNPTDKKIEIQNIKIKAYDANGELLEIFGAQIDAVEAKDSTEIYATIRSDITSAANIEFEIN